MRFVRSRHPHASARRPVRIGAGRTYLGTATLWVADHIDAAWAVYVATVAVLFIVGAGSFWVATVALLAPLPLIHAAQKLQMLAGDQRAEQNFDDVDAILHELEQLQRHLGAIDDVLLLMQSKR